MTTATPTLRPHTQEFRRRVIRSADLQAALGGMEACYRTNGTDDPKGMLLLGPSGAGKTTAAKQFMREHPCEELTERTRRPILYCSLQKGSDRAIMAELLRAAGDPAPTTGTNINSMIDRLDALVTNCDIRMAIIDEVHHVLPEHATTRTQIAADLLKSLMDRLRISLVLVGLPHATRLLQAQRRGDIHQDQLRRRFRRTCHLEPPTIDSKRWHRLLAAYQQALGVPCIKLSSSEMARRLYLATRGLPGRMSNLLAEALELTDGETQIGLDVLANAYEESSAVHDIPENPLRITMRRVDRYLHEQGLVE